MISLFKDYVVKCNKCMAFLYHPDNLDILSLAGNLVREGEIHHANQLAIEYGWIVEANKHICPTCQRNTICIITK